MDIKSLPLALAVPTDCWRTQSVEEGVIGGLEARFLQLRRALGDDLPVVPTYWTGNNDIFLRKKEFKTI